MRYADEMSNVAALQPAGSDRTREEVMSKVPQAVGKSSESIWELMEATVLFWRGKERSWMRRKEEASLGTRPSGEVQNGPMSASSSDCVKGPA